MYRLAYCLSLLFLLPQAAAALGLGELEKHSELNEPFRATIDLIDANAEVLDTLRVKLADAERFRRAGIERPHILSQLRFEVVETDSGPDYIQITSQVPIREPYLNFLIEVTWSSGTLFREYAALLDPPVHHRVTQQAPPKVRASGTARPAATDQAATAPRRRAPARAGEAPIASADSYTTVSGDTLWEIALRARPDRSVAVQQVMMALLRANPDAFFQDNINALKAGAELKIPDLSAIAAVSRSEAQAETSRHWALWEQYRGRVAASPARAPIGAVAATGASAGEGGDRVVARGGSGASDTELPNAELPGAELKLLAANTAGSGAVASDAGAAAVAGDAATLRKNLDIAQETVTSQKQEIGELNSKLAEADEIIKLLRRQIDVKDAELAALQARAAAPAAPQGVAAPDAAPEAAGSQPLESQALGGSPTLAAPGTEAGVPDEAAPLTAGPESGAPAAEISGQPPLETGSATEAPGERPADAPLGTGTIDRGLEGPGPTPAPDAALTEPPQAAPAAPTETVSAGGGLLELIPGGAATLWIGIALILGSVAVLMRRKRAAEPEPDVDLHESDEPVESWDSAARERVPEGDTGAKERAAGDEITGPVPVLEVSDTAPPAAESATSPIEEEDPLSDINVYLAYERFDEAEAAVKQAIAANPDEHKLKLKLLEVYYAAGNNAAFEQYAAVLQSAVGGAGPLWHSALAMWQAMSPGRALFASTSAGEPAFDTAPREFIDISTSIAGTEGLRSGAGEAPPSAASAGTLEVLDFDLGGVAEAVQTSTRERIMDVSTGNELEWDGSGLVLDRPAGKGGAKIIDLGKSRVTADRSLPGVLDLTVADASDRSSAPETTSTAPSTAMSIDNLSGDSLSGTAAVTAEGSVTAAADAPGTIDIGGGPESEISEMEDRGLEPHPQGTRDDLLDFAFTAGQASSRSVESVLGGATIDLAVPDWPEISLGMAQTGARSTATADDRTSATVSEAEERTHTQDDSVEFDLADLDFEVIDTTPPEPVETITMVDMGFEAGKTAGSDASLGANLGAPEQGDDEATLRIDAEGEISSESDVKLNLAKAYIELGDAEGARAILQEVTRDGTAAERDEAAQLLAQIA